jgi:hypothetical protein
LENQAAEDRAEAQLAAAEAEAADVGKARTIYRNIWQQFAEDTKEKGKSAAYVGLKENYALCADDMVPHIMTSGEHMRVISDCDKNISDPSGIAGEDIRDVVSRWLRGDIELSRIPLSEPAPIEQEGNIDEPSPVA